MTSLVAPKPSEGTSPGLMSYGSDPSALDDYLNLDLFGPRPSNSPASSHGPLPMTPNADAAPATVFPPLDQSPGGTLGFSDYTPLDKNFGAFPDLGLPGPSDLSEQYSTLFQDLFPTYAEPGPSAPVIDPQLFTAPPAPPAPPVESDDDSDEEIDEVAPLPARRRPKKNAAAAGGIAKRPSRASTPASIVPSYAQFEDPKPVIPPALGKGGVASYLNGERIGSQEPDEWRPTPEEYKKLSSKEKRQLRNKISARNFRVRRKEYITTLESHIADRDQLISAIRSELSLTHNENNELRREIDALKRAIQQGRLSAEDTGLPPPRPLTPEPQRRPELTRPNTQKDVSNDSRNFWGGVSGHGGVTSVHTTLIPDVFPALSGKPNSPQTLSPPSSASPSTPPNEGVNMNPLMNLSPLFGSSKSTPYAGLDVMDHAFNQRTLDGFRAQLWGRMAKEAGARSVLAERSEVAPQDGDVVFSEPSEMTSPQLESSSSGSSSSASMSPQQSSSSASSPPSITLSSSPSLSMLNQPSTLRSLVESATGRTFDAPISLFQSPTLPAVSITPPSASPAPAVPSPALSQASVPAPALLQASSFGSNFLAAQNPSPSPSFGQNTASIQARAMLQAQWLAMQQSRQAQAQAQTPSPQPTVRETYIAQFSQAAEYQRQQLQAQQQGLSGFAAGVQPKYIATPRSGGHYAPNTDKDKKDKKLSNALEKLSLADKATAQSIKSKSPTSPKSSMPPGIKLAPGTSKSQPTKSSTIPPLKSSSAPQPTKSNSVPQPTKLATVPQPTKSNTIPQPSKSGTTPQQAAMAATIASSTLLSRMGSAFWDAFSGGSRDVDTDKVRRVLEGKAVVRVVDVDVGGLEEKMRGMSVSGDCASGATGVFSNLRGRK